MANMVDIRNEAVKVKILSSEPYEACFMDMALIYWSPLVAQVIYLVHLAAMVSTTNEVTIEVSL